MGAQELRLMMGVPVMERTEPRPHPVAKREAATKDTHAPVAQARRIQTAPIARFIGQQYETLNRVTLLMLFGMLMLVFWLLYEFMSYVPRYSITALIVSLVLLSTAGVLITRRVTGRALQALEQYGAMVNMYLEASGVIHSIKHGDLMLESCLRQIVRMSGSDFGLVLGQADEGVACKAACHGGRGAMPHVHSKPGSARALEQLFEIERVTSRNGELPEWLEAKLDGGRAKTLTPHHCVVPIKGGVKDSNSAVLVMCKASERGYSDMDCNMLEYFARQMAISHKASLTHEDKRNFEIHVTSLLVEALENHVERKGHSRNVAYYALIMARALGLDEQAQQRIYRASMLHDIGMLRINSRALADKERYRSHPELGYRFLWPISLYSDIAPIVRHHHEWYNGSGYPLGLSGEAIPLEARIIAIAEAFDMSLAAAVKANGGKAIPDEGDLVDSLYTLKLFSGKKFDGDLLQLLIDNVSPEDLCQVCTTPTGADLAA